MRVGSFKASLKVGTESLEELDVKVEGSTSTCYVEAQSELTICWSEDSHLPHGDTEGRISLDGGGDISTARLHEDRRSMIKSKVPVGAGQGRLLCFGSITTTEDEDLSVASGSDCDSLGTITVRIYRGVRGIPRFGISDVDNSAFVAGTVHNEVQVKKSKPSMVTTLGDLVPIHASKTVSFESSDRSKAPFITFKFIYRSHSILQALGLLAPDSPIQRPPSLSPVAGPSRPRAARQTPQEIFELSSDDDDLPDTPEVKEAKEHLRLAQQKAAKERSRRKRASTAAELDVKPDIKPNVKKQKLEDQGLIDLTGD